MSQDSVSPAAHRKGVYADPIAQKSKQGYHALSASSVGLELGLSVGIGLLLGWWLDQHLHTAPWLMLLWLLFGLVAGFRGVIRAVKREDRAAAAQEEARG
ncbi:MAG: AtpZ/AtpI family protein [Deltaproteobacteria bacterium]|nr:AtpZ/AtpI family protein [Deltaproteobacteria bacterium]